MKDKHLGILLAITGAALWGTSGTAAEMLYQSPNINTFWLVDVRPVNLRSHGGNFIL